MTNYIFLINHIITVGNKSSYEIGRYMGFAGESYLKKDLGVYYYITNHPKTQRFKTMLVYYFLYFCRCRLDSARMFLLPLTLLREQLLA